MTSNEDGYVLASAVAVLLSLSLVAAALVSASSEGRSRSQRAEAEAANELVLRSAVEVAGSQLAMDPRRRQLAIAGGRAVIDVVGRSVEVRLGWENEKLDVNTASIEDIELLLRDADLEIAQRNAVLAAIRARRALQEPVRLLDDVLSPGGECLHSVLTVFGGRAEYSKDAVAAKEFGRPGSGARLAVEVRLASQKAAGLAAVVLMTGDPAAPVRVLDWRSLRGSVGETCHGKEDAKG